MSSGSRQTVISRTSSGPMMKSSLVSAGGLGGVDGLGAGAAVLDAGAWGAGVFCGSPLTLLNLSCSNRARASPMSGARVPGASCEMAPRQVTHITHSPKKMYFILDLSFLGMFIGSDIDGASCISYFVT